jgi:PAS domain S-box-containing protein
MKQPDPALKVLILEDSITDAELIKRLLNKELKQMDFRIAMDKKSFIHSLHSFSPDVVLSDNSLPQFNSSEALKITRGWLRHVPFILVTGTVSEEYAAEMIRLGADDYILKDRMARLPAAIESAIERRRAIKESADYRYALDQAAIVATTDQKGIILYANDNFCKISKYSSDELVGQDHRIINSGYHSPEFMKTMWATIGKGNIWRGEILNKAKDRSFYWVETCIVPFLDEMGKPYQYLSIRNDITERKRIEQELLTANERFELVVSATNDVIWDWNFKTNKVWWNKNYFLYFGFDPGNKVSDRNSWQDHVHPDDKERVVACIQDSIDSMQQTWTDEYRFIKADGKIAHILDYGYIVYNKENEPYRMVGAMIDISNRKRAEEELRQSNERFKLAAQATSDLIWEMNFDTKEYLIHQGEQKLFSNTRELTYQFGIGNELIVEPDLARVSKSFNEALENSETEFWEEEYRMLTTGSKILYLINRAIFVRDEKGRAIKAIGALTDITEKRRLRDELFEQQKNEQILITATSMEAQEKERNHIGQELHDNVNQILAGTNLYLSLIKGRPDKSQEYIDHSIFNIRSAIEENRKISKILVTPDFGIIFLYQLLFRLADSMLETSGIDVRMEIEDFDEDILKSNQKLTIYRIAQEQCTNIVRYAGAHVVDIRLSTLSGVFKMKIDDDGVGMEENKESNGIGIRNIKARLSMFQGKAQITSAPGKGYTLEVEMPIMAA